MRILKPADAFDKSAKIYQDKFMDVSLYAEELSLFCDNIKTNNASILDIACGPGNITKHLLTNRTDFEILGIDISPKMLDLAQTNNPTARFRLMDCRDLDKIEQKFDGITCGFCLPYLTPAEVTELVVNVSILLKTGGVLYLSTMEEDDHNKSRYQMSSTGDQVYVNYHNENWLIEVLTGNNFEIVNLKRFSSPDKDGVTITDLVIIVRLMGEK